MLSSAKLHPVHQNLLYQQIPSVHRSLPPQNNYPVFKQNQQIQQKKSLYEVEDNDNFMKFQKSVMDIKFKQIITYQQLINQYDRILSFDLKDQRLLMHQVLLLQIQMQPENMFWIIWRNSSQILDFLEEIQEDIRHLMQVQQIRYKTGPEIATLHARLLKQWTNMNENSTNQLYGTMDMNLVNQFIQWLHFVSEHPYLRKNVQYLIFVSHCLPIDKWNMQIYQQLYIRKPFNIVDKVKELVSQKKPKRRKQYFLTITSDGILKSDDHLLLSKVDSMIPFTNLMKVKQERKGDHIYYFITSGNSQAWEVNFHDDYVQAINFACGLGRARIDAYYKAPYKALSAQFNQYSRQDYEEQQKLQTQPHRFNSFAPPRSNCGIKLYNDGCGYFEDLYACIMNAKFQICITDWMMTPYFLLRRPGSIDNDNIENRLDGILGQAAQRGVKIFIILFMEPAMFVNNDSEGAAKVLEGMHKNIKVLRHPNVAVPIIWSHHQKLCVIDQKIGFMGGLDICYGRWDTPEHKLVQIHDNTHRKYWDGCDFNNFRTSDIYEPREFKTSNLNPDFQPRMPWHDIALQMRGDSVIDLLRHFVQYWYFVKSEYKFSPRRFFQSFKNKQSKLKKRQIGKQMKQAAQQFIEEKWQLLREDIADEFFPGHQQRTSQLLIEQRTGLNCGNTNIQMLRSANNWSIGADVNHPQKSIHQAYKKLIERSQNHIYIENQFFMGLKNEIVKTLCARITRAFYDKKPFKVIIVVPLLPGFEGDPGDPGATVLRIQIHWQKVAIMSGNDSIYNTLKTTCPGINISDYLFFFGLRKWQVLNKCPITEIIYVHSKLMIVDDKAAICGSANINDRSLTGSGDSEIAVCIQETQQSGNHLFDLRCRLFDEHFAFSKQETADITNPAVWNKLLQRAKTNTLIYRQVFGCIPDDEVTTHQEIDILASMATFNVSKLKNIVGHVVEYPLKFMDDEDLEFSIGQKEYYAPVESFT